MANARADQTRLLRALVGGAASPPCVVVHGAPSTGKTTCVREFLAADGIAHAWVNCDECATARVLLQRALKQLLRGIGSAASASCENVDVFCAVLAREFAAQRVAGKRVLVLDNFSEMPELFTQRSLLAALPRLYELGVPANFVVIVVLAQAEPKPLLHNLHTPRVFFPRFTPAEALAVLETLPLEPAGAFRTEFFRILVQAAEPVMGTHAGDLARAARKIWPEFYRPDASAAKRYAQTRHLFGPAGFVDTLPPPPAAQQQAHGYACAMCLVAAYLASYNSPRYDMRCFSLAKGMRSKRRETHPKKAARIPARSLPPPLFEMERLLAILHAILPNAYDVAVRRDVGTALATLQSQRLIAASQPDFLDSRTKWRITAPFSYVQMVATSIDFPLHDYLAE